MTATLGQQELVRKLAAPDDIEVAALDAWWRANNYLTVGQIYLQGNPLLREPLTSEHIKPRLLGHWGTSPGLSFVYAHVSRLIKETGQQAIYLAGPGHGGPALVAAGYLEGTYSEVYPKVGLDEDGLLTLFRQFSSPGGIPSHVSVTTPGSIHEGGELGYVLVHAFGAVMDNPDLLAIAVVGDGEAETGPLEGSWKGVSFINPEHDGAVLPILHLNGAKIAGPTVLARKDPAEVRKFFEGHGYDVLEVGGEDLPGMHHRFAQTLAEAWGKIKSIQDEARGGTWDGKRPNWPLIVMRTPKGWTGPEKIDGITVTGTWRSHQVPLSGVKGNDQHLADLEKWLKSYRPEELFDATGAPVRQIRDAAPPGDLRMSASPHANGGLLTEDLDLPDFRDYAIDVKQPAVEHAESTRKLGEMMRDIYSRNPDSFRLFCPDETNSNRLGAVFEVSDRGFMETVTADDVKISNKGRVMEVLSEHNCHGWLEGYNLTGRHGMFATYEAFAMVSASQTVQHGKWLQEASHLPWRAKVPSLNILLTSTAWRNDHNGFSHQGPGLLSVVLNQRGNVARVYLPPDANTLLSVADHCFRSRSYVNLIVIDKQPQLQWLTMDQAIEHCKQGAGIWDWAGNDDGGSDPDIVLACAGDVVTMETVAAAQILKEKLPQLKVRVVNVVNLMTLPRPKDHPHGLSETLFRELFTDHVDVVFSFHGYPGAIHQLVHGRPDADRFRVRGFIEQGTTTTPFDMTVRNRASRYHLVMDAINNAKRLPAGASELKAWCEKKLEKHEKYVVENLEDMPEVRDWSLGDWAEH
ncbi:phosphoketolase family protein [Actinoplanes derwentensis]|uniref:Xylulose-5-phosphate/fructose-6-phosphate phosphoketolase n=1 Tax=Actinoplanes derwentensis TaxID=113562 RepID=A0A1H2AE14_9ACTN|nr:phosphoketolase family protein [Actinoplanes derwentensis]GID88227.1 putative phosphoketolase [Actinoplanes derwentensis]SDT44193.1 xylulose-5-phosphate/fructose-6-phosphate phosphoketolase [Actinoplanes derwentensis]